MIRKRRVSKGQGLVEYALIIALIGLATVGGLEATGYSLRDVYCAVAQGISGRTSCQGPEHYFYDDFDNMDQWKVVRGNWYTEDGKLCGGPGEGRIFADVPQSGDYVINLKGANLAQGNGYGLYFRSSNVDQVNGYTFQFDPGYAGGSYLLRRWYQGREFRPSAAVRDPNMSWHGTSHDIKLVVQGDTITAFVDGRQVYQVHDSTWSEGGVGLRTWDHTKVCFDSISVDPIP
jgi:Flp pilus assembly pilin Flp